MQLETEDFARKKMNLHCSLSDREDFRNIVVRVVSDAKNMRPASMLANTPPAYFGTF